VGSKISLGSLGDSYYEYLLKQWLQSGRREHHFKDQWKLAMKEAMDSLVIKTRGGLTFIAMQEHGRPKLWMEHLACYVPGMLMLGSRTLPPEEVDPRWEPVAAEVTRTCYEMYRRSPTGLAPEYVGFDLHSTSNDMKIPPDAPHNMMRPEAIEAIYYMWYFTGDPKYRQWGYELFTAFQRHSRTRFGFSSVADVRTMPVVHKDEQESFWLGETLKYLFLLFTPRSTLSLEEFVLSTEGQPLRAWS